MSGYGLLFFDSSSTYALHLEGYAPPFEECRVIVYKGNFVNGEISGDGIALLKNGVVIIGQFEAGQLRDTNIQQMFPNGDHYAGGHRGGIKKGAGQYYQKDTDVTYDGFWVDNMKEGKGEITYPNQKGAKFTGDFVADECVQGEYTDPLGNVFKTMVPSADMKSFIIKQAKLEGTLVRTEAEKYDASLKK